MPHRIRQLLPWAGFLAAYLALQLFVGYRAPAGPPPLLAGTSLSGTAIDLSQLRGRPALIYFWASWCGICRGMQHNIVAVAHGHPVITVAMQSGNVMEVARYQDEHDFHPPTLLDEAGDIAYRYGVHGVPAIFVLDPNGQIRFSSSGYQTELGMRLRLWLAETL
ncbi:MAG: protein disulfide oxidoreductase [Methylococcaceae bacterium]|nr:protein disulfide oxidoreductase [Methylococcaceae bacterium]